jgi:hypothetical protein
MGGFDRGSGPRAPGGLGMTDGYMRVRDLIKATVVCGGVAFLVYSFPVLSQVLIIVLLTLMWFSCAHQTVQTLRRKGVS